MTQETERRARTSVGALSRFVGPQASLGFGAWALADYSRSGRASVLLLGVLGFAAAAALIWYGFWFLRKLKNVSYL